MIAPYTRSAGQNHPGSAYERIYAVVRRIPRGRVSTYGRVARMAGRCTARMVGYAMAALPAGSDIPWQRVINHKGEISPRRDGSGEHQRARLLQEGVVFDPRGRVRLDRFGWPSDSPLLPGSPQHGADLPISS